MSALTLLFALMLGAVSEAVLPTWHFMGQASIPIILGVVLYYALYYPRSYWLTAAILGGLFQDSLGLVPLGYAAVCFSVVAVLASRFREVMFLHEFLSHVWIGASASAISTALLFGLLKGSGLTAAGTGWIVVRIVGSALLGAVCVPLVMAVMAGVDKTLGNVKWGEI